MPLTALFVAVFLAASALAESAPHDGLDESFQALLKLEAGQDLQQFQPIDLAIMKSRTDASLRKDLEIRLVDVLQNEATELAIDYACRQLALVGSDTCVPALAALLPNARLSHVARHALEGNGSPVAAAALRVMLQKTNGRQQAGVVVSLGRLADPESVAPIAALLATKDDELREVSLVALGRIGTVPAGEALLEYAGRAAKPWSSTLVDAELNAVESMCKHGEYGTAIAICNSLETSNSEQVKAAAFRGLIAAQPAESLALILGGLAAEQSWKRAVATDCAIQLKTPEEINAIADAIPDLPTAGKIAVLTCFKDRRDPAVRVAALQALQDSEVAVRIAAITSLLASGTADDVAELVIYASLADNPVIRQASCETIRLMHDEGTNQALLELLERSPQHQPLILECALARRSPTFLPAFLKAAESAAAETRQQAFQALEVMASPAEAEALVNLLSKTSPGPDRAAADRATWIACKQITDPDARTSLLVAALSQADRKKRCAILPTLARIGGPEVLSVTHAAMQSSDQSLRDAGYRALANWSDDSVADELLEIAKNSSEDKYRIWALRAYARVVSLPSDRPPEATFEMLGEAMNLATRLEEQELIVSRLGAVRVPEALVRLLEYIDRPELKDASLPATYKVAKGLSKSHPDQARAALEKILPLTDDAAIRQQIPKVLRDIDDRKSKDTP